MCRDTAGQERYASLAPLYYRGAAAAAIVYDITSEDSFRKAKHWVSELQKNAGSGIGVLDLCVSSLSSPKPSDFGCLDLSCLSRCFFS